MGSMAGIINKFRKYLPVTENTPVITLHEGSTPLIKVVNFGNVIDRSLNIYLKFEGMNPTGSFKDRGLTMAISKALEEGSKAVICASTGNTSASAAAYSARAGLKSFVLIPEGKIAKGKLSQALLHNATVIQIKGNFDDAMKMVKEIAQNYPVTLVNSINPYRLQGQKTAAMEICNVLGFAPDYHALPVGNAGNITANSYGYKDYKNDDKIKSLPKMLGFQAEGSAPIVRGHVIKSPETIATAIRIGNPENWKLAASAIEETEGRIDMVSDTEILDTYRLLANLEGIFCEPASAASLAGVIKLSGENYFPKGSTIVCTLTGHGLKDPDTAIQNSAQTFLIEPNIKEALAILGF